MIGTHALGCSVGKAAALYSIVVAISSFFMDDVAARTCRRNFVSSNASSQMFFINLLLTNGERNSFCTLTIFYFVARF